MVYHEGQARGLPIGVLNAPEDLFDDEHLVARDFFATVEQPGYGPVTYPTTTYRMSHYSGTAPAPAPALGADNAALLDREPTA